MNGHSTTREAPAVAVPIRMSASCGLTIGPARNARATDVPTIASAATSAEAREDREIEVRRAGDRADQIARLAQPPQPLAQPVPRAVRDDVEAGAQHD